MMTLHRRLCFLSNSMMMRNCTYLEFLHVWPNVARDLCLVKDEETSFGEATHHLLWCSQWIWFLASSGHCLENWSHGRHCAASVLVFNQIKFLLAFAIRATQTRQKSFSFEI